MLRITVLSIFICLATFDLHAQNTTKSNTGQQLFIDTLQVGSSYQIIFHSTGCFHNYWDTLSVSRNSKNYFLKYKNQETTLKRKNLERYKQFEQELRFDSHEGLCTKRDQYLIKTHNLEETITMDGSCHWDGFENLLDDLFK